MANQTTCPNCPALRELLAETLLYTPVDRHPESLSSRIRAALAHNDALHWLGRKTGGAVTWTAFYRACREEMAFRYGKVRVPTDYYKEHFVPEGSDVQQAVRTVYQRLRAEGRVP